MGLVPVSGFHQCRWVWSEVEKEALRVLEELETEFPGKILPLVLREIAPGPNSLGKFPGPG